VFPPLANVALTVRGAVPAIGDSEKDVHTGSSKSQISLHQSPPVVFPSSHSSLAVVLAKIIPSSVFPSPQKFSSEVHIGSTKSIPSHIQLYHQLASGQLKFATVPLVQRSVPVAVSEFCP
jgi:hypothetical protein